jgi:hypothetical protein
MTADEIRNQQETEIDVLRQECSELTMDSRLGNLYWSYLNKDLAEIPFTYSNSNGEIVHSRATLARRVIEGGTTIYQFFTDSIRNRMLDSGPTPGMEESEEIYESLQALGDLVFGEMRQNAEELAQDHLVPENFDPDTQEDERDNPEYVVLNKAPRNPRSRVIRHN